MELVVLLAGLYVAQCLVHLSPAAAIFRRRMILRADDPDAPDDSRAGSWTWRRGECLVLSSVFPWKIDIVAERLLPTEWVGGARVCGARSGESRCPNPPGSDISVSSRRVTIDGRALFRLSTPGAAATLRALLREAKLCAQQTTEVRNDSTGESEIRVDDDVLGVFVNRGLSAEHATSRLRASLEETRLLGAYAGLYMAFLFGCLPALILLRGEVLAFLLMVPLLTVLHAGTTYECWRVHGVLDLSAHDRLSEVLMGFLYPPSLFRARHDLVQAAMASVHPATLAAVLTQGGTLRRFLAGELGYVEGRLDDRGEGQVADSLLARERKLLLELVAIKGLTPAEFERPRLRTDAAACAYCPRCESDFARPTCRCTDCGSRMRRYAETDAV